MGEDIKTVKRYKYLGFYLNCSLDWRKRMSRLYFLGKLRSFNVCSKMLVIFDQSVVASAIYCAVVCSIRARDTGRNMNKLRPAASLDNKMETFESILPPISQYTAETIELLFKQTHLAPLL